MTNERWVIALVRYESSVSWYLYLNAEQKEVLYFIDGHEYDSLGPANNVISRWENAKPRKLPYFKENREKLPNGRWELYRWEPLLLDQHDRPGFYDAGRSGATAYRLIEYPRYNDPEAGSSKYLTRRERWGGVKPVRLVRPNKGPYKGGLITLDGWQEPKEQLMHDDQLQPVLVPIPGREE